MEYGTDITFDGNDIGPSLSLTTDNSIVLEALSFRLQSDSGSLWYDPDYGFNVNNLIKSPINANGISNITRRIENECYKDKRVQGASCSITGFSLKTKAMRIEIKITLTNGATDSLVFNINDSSADLTKI